MRTSDKTYVLILTCCGSNEGRFKMKVLYGLIVAFLAIIQLNVVLMYPGGGKTKRKNILATKYQVPKLPLRMHLAGWKLG